MIKPTILSQVLRLVTIVELMKEKEVIPLIIEGRVGELIVVWSISSAFFDSVNSVLKVIIHSKTNAFFYSH